MLCRRQFLIPELADLPLPYPLCFKMEMNEAQNYFKYHFTWNSNHHFSLCFTVLFIPCFPMEKERKRKGKRSHLITGRVHERVFWKQPDCETASPHEKPTGCNHLLVPCPHQVLCRISIKIDFKKLKHKKTALKDLQKIKIVKSLAWMKKT